MPAHAPSRAWPRSRVLSSGRAAAAQTRKDSAVGSARNWSIAEGFAQRRDIHARAVGRRFRCPRSQSGFSAGRCPRLLLGRGDSDGVCRKIPKFDPLSCRDRRLFPARPRFGDEFPFPQETHRQARDGRGDCGFHGHVHHDERVHGKRRRLAGDAGKSSERSQQLGRALHRVPRCHSLVGAKTAGAGE